MMMPYVTPRVERAMTMSDAMITFVRALLLPLVLMKMMR